MLDKGSHTAINPANETFSHEGVIVHFLLAGEQSNGSVAAFEVTVPGSKRLLAPAHSHDRYEETIYGIEGILTWTVDGHRHDVGPGQALCIPRGSVHRFDNDGKEAAKVLCVVTPAAIGPDYFRETFAVLNAAVDGPPDGAKMVEIMHRHGITPASRPLQA
jgi:quercetin dioxygenase-like cupin family protein